jgi:hypothetical protein
MSPTTRLSFPRPNLTQHSSSSFPHSNNFRRRTVPNDRRRWIYIPPSLSLTFFLLTDLPLRHRQFFLAVLPSTSRLVRVPSCRSCHSIDDLNSRFRVSSSRTTLSSLTGETSLARNPNVSSTFCSSSTHCVSASSTTHLDASLKPQSLEVIKTLDTLSTSLTCQIPLLSEVSNHHVAHYPRQRSLYQG